MESREAGHWHGGERNCACRPAISIANLIVCTAASNSASHDERHTSLDFRAKLATTARVLEPLAKLVAEPLVLLAGGEDDQVVDVGAYEHGI